MNYLYTDTIYGKPTEDDIRTEKADAVIKADAGYDPETTIKIPMTQELRNYVDIYRLKTAISEIEAGNQQRLKFLEEEKEVKAERQREALSDASEAIAQQDREVWLREDHYFAGYRLTGRQMEHVGKYYRDNKEQIHQQWLEEGHDTATIARWDRYIEMSANGGPKTEAEKIEYDNTARESGLQQKFGEIIETSGLEAQAVPQSNSPANDKPAINHTAEMGMSF